VLPAERERACRRGGALLYEKALETDPVSERFFQGLMRCHLDLGQRADGLAVYQRCRAALARELQLAPSAKTEALRAALLSC
jgi:DNA-binding SARP family transcriptional activator